MEMLATVVMVSLAIGAGAYVIYAIEHDKPWTREFLRVLSAIELQRVPLDLQRELQMTRLAPSKVQVAGAIADKAANDDAELVA